MINSARTLPIDYKLKGTTYLTEVLEDISTKVHKAVIDRLKTTPASPKRFVTLAIDGLTDKGAKVTAVNALNGTSAFFIESIYNTDAANTADWIAPKLAKIIDRLIKEGIIIVGIVADNESVNVATIKKLKEKFPVSIAASWNKYIVRHSAAW